MMCLTKANEITTNNKNIHRIDIVLFLDMLTPISITINTDDAIYYFDFLSAIH